MFEILVLILMLFVLFKITGFFFHVAGAVLGCIFGIIGYVLLGVFYVAAFGMAIVFLPLILLIGVAVIAALVANPA